MTDIQEDINQEDIIGAVTMLRYVAMLKRYDVVKKVNFIYMDKEQFDTFQHNWGGHTGVPNVHLRDTIIGETIEGVYFKFIKGFVGNKEKVEKAILSGEIKVIRSVDYSSGR